MTGLIERVARARQLWLLLLPACSTPSDAQLARWAGRFSDAELEFVLTRTARKHRKGLLPDADVCRYVTGTLVNVRNSNEVIHA